MSERHAGSGVDAVVIMDFALHIPHAAFEKTLPSIKERGKPFLRAKYGFTNQNLKNSFRSVNFPPEPTNLAALIIADRLKTMSTATPTTERIVPELPPTDQVHRLLIDTDAGTEIDDLYAIALALRSPDRFVIEGIVATHFAQNAGRQSIEASYQTVQTLLELDGAAGQFPVARGGDPMRYIDEPSDSAGAQLIIERALADADQPLWVVGLGAATNLAAAIMLEPRIASNVRYVYHARSALTWPERSVQYNVAGDVHAARVLLSSDVPLAWFDTGQQLTCSMSVTEERLLPLGGLAGYLHEFRHRKPYYQREDKGFFDLADIAWMIDPSVCTNEVVDAPKMDYVMQFQHRQGHGQMLRVHQCQAEPIWDMFFQRMAGSG